MPDTRISDLTVLTAPAAGDLISIVDISDTTMAASGTTKRVAQSVLLASVQPLDATLTALAGLTIAADSLAIGTGADAFTQTTFAANTFPARASTGSLVAKPITDFGLSLIDDAAASNARTTLGLGTIATQDASSVAITGGTINGAPVGATTPSTGAFTALSATGITTVAAGTAALPSIVSTTGTADTGLWFPAADTLAASTAGVERIRIGSTGNVGIGTTNPGAALEVSVSSASIRISDTANNTGAGDVQSSLDLYGRYWSSDPVAYPVAKIAAIHQEANGSGGGVLAFSTQGAGSLTVAERMRIDKSGNVGIGTTSPSYLLHVNTDSAGKPGVGGLWTVVSDERIKTDIVPADLSRCYDIVKQVGLKHFGFKPGVYSDEQINDKHSLGWIAQDVQKVFGKAVSIKPFTLQTDIPDGTEEYEEQEFTVETVNKVETSIQVINGKPLQASKTTQVEEKTLLFDEVVVVDVAGDIVMVDGEPLTHKVPRMVTKTRPKVRREVIEDCLDLNGGQMNAALYGAVQCLMSKVEAQAVIIASLQASVAEQAHS